MTEESERLIQRARESFERRDYVAALADLRDVISDHPHFADVRHLMGLCLSFLGQPDAALEQFDRALEANDRYIEAHLNRAIVLNEMGRYDEAREAFERAAECERQTGGRFSASESARLANAHAGVAELYLAASAPARAAEELRTALELGPEPASTWGWSTIAGAITTRPGNTGRRGAPRTRTTPRSART
jgi:tetratricopeptide (TPR) repeat protein